MVYGLLLYDRRPARFKPTPIYTFVLYQQGHQAHTFSHSCRHLKDVPVTLNIILLSSYDYARESVGQSLRKMPDIEGLQQKDCWKTTTYRIANDHNSYDFYRFCHRLT